MAQTHTAAEVFPPGEFLRDELEARGWSQADLADIMGRPVQMINEIIAAKKVITPDTAKALGAALGTSAELWMNLESAYQLSLINRDVAHVAKRAKIYGKVPVKEMIRRGWIKDQTETDDLEKDVLRFLEIENLDQTPQLNFAARKGTDYSETTAAQIAWLCRVKKLGRTVKAAQFSQRCLEQFLATVPMLTSSEFEIRKLPKLLADVGVRLVVVEHLGKTKIDGAALWIDDKKPVVAVSLRYGRIDHFWFTLCHELIHIKYHDHGSLDINLVGESAECTTDKPETEQRADREAADMLVNQVEFEKFVRRVKPLYSKQRIIQFANRLQIHPAIIVGQLQRRDEIGYNHSREMLVGIRDILTPVALTDGWGHVPPALLAM